MTIPPKFGTFLALAAVLSMTGCASRPSAEAPQAAPADLVEKVEAALPQTDPDVLYYVGAAELSGMREQFQLSAELYARAAELSSDPAIAAQAVKVAAFANEETLTLEGVDRWLSLQPGHPEPHRIAAILHLRKDDAEKAWEHLSAILDPQPPVERWEAVMNMLGQARGRGAALTVLRRIDELYDIPADGGLRQRMSDLAVQLGDLELADRFASMALETDPNSAASYNWRGRLRTSLSRYDEARSDFEKAIDLDPDNDQIRQTFAALLAELEDYEGAIAQLEQVEPGLLVVFSKGIYAQEAGDEALALRYYEDLKQQSAEDENEKWFFLGQLAEALERPYQETVDWYDQVRSGSRIDGARLRAAVVLGRNGELPKARVILHGLQNGNAQTATNAYLAEGSLLRDLDQLEDAMAVFDQALELLPEQTDLLFSRALLAEQLDDIDQTEADLRRVLELQPGDPNALNALGYTLADRTERYDEALALIEQAMEQLPDEPAFVDSMGWVQYKLGNHEEALAYLERALSLQYDSEIAAHLGEVLWVLGRQEDARKVWQEALEREPDSPILQETVARFASQ